MKRKSLARSAAPQRMSALETSVSNFYEEFLEFRTEMIEFKTEMIGFKVHSLSFEEQMVEFRSEMLEFKDRTQTTLDYVVGTLETLLQEFKLFNATFSRQETTVGGHEKRLLKVEKHLGFAT